MSYQESIVIDTPEWLTGKLGIALSAFLIVGAMAVGILLSNKTKKQIDQ